MKKINVFIAVTLAILMSVGVAFATPPSNERGYYIKTHGATAGTIKYFSNGHPQPQDKNEWLYCGDSASKCDKIEPPTPCPGCNGAKAGNTYHDLASGGSFESIKLPGPDVEGPSSGFNGSGIGGAEVTVNTQIVASKFAFESGYGEAKFKNPVTEGKTYTIGDADSDYMGALAWSKQSGSAEAFGGGTVTGYNKWLSGCDYPEGFVSVDLFAKGGAYSSQYAQVAFKQTGADGYAGATGWQGSTAEATKSTYVDATEWNVFGVKGATGIVFEKISAGASVFGASGADITRVGNQSMDTNSVVARSFNLSISNPGYVTGNPDTSSFNVSGAGMAVGSVYTSSPLGMSGSASYAGNYSYAGTATSPIYGAGFTYGTAAVSITPTSVTSTSSGFSWAGTGQNLYKPTQDK